MSTLNINENGICEIGNCALHAADLLEKDDLAQEMRYITKTQNIYSEIAGEQVFVEKIKSAIYAWGSELGTLRLFRAYNRSEQKYSKAKNKFCFVIEQRFEIPKFQRLKNSSWQYAKLVYN